MRQGTRTHYPHRHRPANAGTTTVLGVGDMKGTYPRVRVWVRVIVNDAIDRHVPLEIPSSSTFADIHDEVLRVTNAPTIPGPWELASPIGRVLSTDTPLGDIVHPGGTVILRPVEEPRLPLLRDAAEELAALADPPDPAPSTALTFVTIAGGLMALLTCCLLMPLPAMIASWWWLRVGLAAVVMMALASALRLSWVFAVAVITSMVALSLGVAGFGIPQAGLAAGVLTLLAGLLSRPWPVSWRACAGCFGLLLTMNAGLLWALSSTGRPALEATTGVVAAGGALGCAVCLAGLLLSARIATAIAGIRPPLIPGAGDDLGIGDEVMTHRDAARTARAVHSGFIAGLSLLLCLAAGAVTLTASPSAVVLLCCLGLSTSLQAQRIPHRAVGLCLHVVTLVLVVTAVVGLWAAQVAPGWWTFPIVAAAMLTAVPLWQQPWRRVRPTTTVWLERVESVAIVIALPLALLCAGVFQVLRELAL